MDLGKGLVVETVETAIEIADILTGEVAILLVCNFSFAEIAFDCFVFRVKHLSSN